jgi:hypothetical protein
VRRESFEITGGTPGVSLIPETDLESHLTPVEQASLTAAFAARIGPAAADQWVRLARVQSRDCDGWGGHVNLIMPTPDWTTVPDCSGSDDWGAGESTRGFRVDRTPSASIEWSGRPCLINAVILGPDGGEAAIDLHPMGDPPLDTAACERLLYATLGEIRITPE